MLRNPHVFKYGTYIQRVYQNVSVSPKFSNLAHKFNLKNNANELVSVALQSLTPIPKIRQNYHTI